MDVCAIHQDIVSEYSNTDRGIRDPGAIEFALDYIRDGVVGKPPETVHRKAFHLLRLLVANHPFVDGNKRTALSTVATFYVLNGFRFEYDEEIRSILKKLGTDEAAVDEAEVVDYLRSRTTESNLDDEIDPWREELIRFGVAALEGDEGDQND